MAILPVDATFDIAVIGGGPAGLAAAVTSKRAGARVVLVDGGSRVGGQYWRHRDGDSGAGHHLWATFRELRAEILDVVVGRAVWHVERTGDGFTVHTTAGAPIRARQLIVATGAYDRQLPFPGWTLPGVYTAGGAQALLKGNGVRVGRRVVVAGTGPFLLPVAAGLATAGAKIVGVFEANSAANFRRHPGAVLRNLTKLAEGVGYLAALARNGVRVHERHAVIAAHGGTELRSVTVAKIDADWRVVAGSEREVECDALAVGYGFTPQLEIPLQLGCATRLDVDGSLIGVVDAQQRATVPGVYLAGEVCGVGGAQLSLVEGELAALHATTSANAGTSGRTDAASADIDGGRLAGNVSRSITGGGGTYRIARLLRRRDALRAFGAAMHASYPVRPGWIGWLDGDTIVCRCEEVTEQAIRESVVELGATDPRGVKLLARPGMGLCQGRVCGYATACLTTQLNNRETTVADLRGMGSRPVAQPVTLGQLATMEE